MTDAGQQRLDPRTIEDLYAEHAGDLKPFLIGLLRNMSWAEEALQNTFGQALRKGHEVSPDAWRAWLFRVAYHEAMSLRRRQAIDARAVREIARRAPPHGLPVDADLIRVEQLDRLQAAIQTLPPDQQIVVLKRTRGEQTFQQIADELGIPLGTVLTRMRLALARLRVALKDIRE